MELGQQLKTRRTAAGMTQDDLAEKLYVTRQTVSNWENDKSYPDIHSLLMLSELFHVSLDELIKGDLKTMKEKVNQSEIERYKRAQNVFTVWVFVCLLSIVPLYKWLGTPGLAAWAPLLAATIYSSCKVEKIKKEQDIHTYREIVAFVNGEKLDEIEKARESGKRLYQNAAKLLVGAAAGIFMAWLLTGLWALLSRML